MSKILDKIKSFGHSLTTMFQENDQIEDVGYLDPDSKEGQELANGMKPFVDELNKLEEARRVAEKARVESINNSTSKKQYSRGLQENIKIGETRYIDSNTNEGKKLASEMRPVAKKLNDMEKARRGKSDDKSIGGK